MAHERICAIEAYLFPARFPKRKKANSPPLLPDTESATFEIYKQYYAVCGNSHGSIEDGVKVTVRGAKNVDLGILNDDGTRTPGTTLKLTVTKNAPFFDLNLPAPTAYPNSFEIDTQPDFTMLEAKQSKSVWLWRFNMLISSDNYMIGLGGSSSGGDKTPAALFIPQPNVKYQIQPANTYYLAYGDYTPGALIDVAKIGETLAIDFAHHSPIASVVHNAYGALVLQVTE